MKLEKILFSILAGCLFLIFNIVAFRNGVFGLLSSRSDLALLGAPILGLAIIILDYYVIKFIVSLFGEKKLD